jgi:GTPase SAR1 family protein
MSDNILDIVQYISCLAFKVVLIGGSSVGKSSIFQRYMQGQFNNKSQVTMSASFMEKVVPVAGAKKPIKI